MNPEEKKERVRVNKIARKLMPQMVTCISDSLTDAQFTNLTILTPNINNFDEAREQSSFINDIAPYLLELSKNGKLNQLLLTLIYKNDFSKTAPSVLALKNEYELLIKSDLDFEDEPIEVEDTEEKIDKNSFNLIKGSMEKSLGFYYIISLIPIAISIGLLCFFFSENSINLGEGFGSSTFALLSGFPIREIIKRKDKISTLDVLIVQIQNTTNKQEQTKINSIYWNIIETTMLKA